MAYTKNMFAALALTSSLFSLTQATVPTVDGFKLTWSDDFVGTANSLPNTADWKAMTGTQYEGGAANWGTNEIETVSFFVWFENRQVTMERLANNLSQYTSSTENLALTGNGSLSITARKDASGAWTSARLESARSDFGCEQGGKMRIQGSLSLPPLGENGIGVWPAFWTLGANFRQNVT